jgi:uncharacterized protein (TIGR02145 family)
MKKYIQPILVSLAVLLFGSCSWLLDIEEPGSGNSAVDLGLSVKWASCNLGASSPEKSGNFYAWGETSPKSSFGSMDGYKWSYPEKSSYGDEIRLYSKYNASKDQGKVDNKSKLDKDDDAAIAKLGGKWRMPTKKEFAELIENCEMSWTTVNGVNGMEFKSTINGKTIFLPAAGLYGPKGNSNPSGTTLSEAGKSGYYWSSELNSSPTQVAALCIKSNYQNVLNAIRTQGLTIRPVCD